MTREASTRLAPLLLVVLLGLSGCPTDPPDVDDDDSSALDDDDSSPADDDDSAEPWVPCETSPERAPEREVPFQVQVPDDTPDGDTVYLAVLDPIPWSIRSHTPMTETAPGIWTATALVPEGGLVRYVYDRWDEQDWGAQASTREATDPGRAVENRLLFVDPALVEVVDVVRGWADLPSEGPTGSLSGVVTDSATGEPVMDATVSVAGIHLASHYDGSFEAAGLAPGQHRVTVHDARGRFRMATTTVVIEQDQQASAALELAPSEPVEVLFEVDLPEDTPPDARVAILGSLRPLGARQTHYPYEPLSSQTPLMEQVAADRVELTLDLRAGQYAELVYSLGGATVAAERRPDSGLRWRSFVVDPTEPVRCDTIDSWLDYDGGALATVHAEVPPGTTPDAFIDWWWGGRMVQTGERRWTQYVLDFPGNSLEYRYVLGGLLNGVDATPDLPDGTRTLTMLEGEFEVFDVVERWSGLPQTTAGTVDLPVSFAVSLPPDSGGSVRLVGDIPGLAGGVPMDEVEGNPALRQLSLELPAGPVRVHLDRGSEGTGSVDSFDIDVGYGGQEVHLWVSAWADGPQPEGRPDYLGGFYPPDYWTPAFGPLSAGLFERVASRNGSWVALSSVWSYGQLEPLPTLEVKPRLAGSVHTPLPDLLEQISLAHQAGLSVLLAPQFGLEETSDGAVVPTDGGQVWWEAWLELAERSWMWHALVAEEQGVEALLLPGPVYHAFPPADFFEPESYGLEFDAAVAALIEQVRQVYSGLLVVNGGDLGYDHPGQADMVGLTGYDLVAPDLPLTASLEQWQEGYEEVFASYVDPRHDRWGSPILFYQLHVPGHPEAPHDPVVQATRIEAVFQAIDARPFVAGTFSWAYDYIDAPLLADDGVRGRPAEAVTAKHYARFALP